MPEMGIAAAALDFSASHAVIGIYRFVNLLRRYRGPEAWPAAAGIVFLRRRKQLIAAAHAEIGAFFLILVVLTRKCSLGAPLTRHLILLRSQLIAPFFIGFDNFLV